MKHIHHYNIGINRNLPDNLAVSAESINRLVHEIWVNCFRTAVKDALRAGIKLPRYINITGVIEIDGLEEELKNDNL